MSMNHFAGIVTMNYLTNKQIKAYNLNINKGEK